MLDRKWVREHPDQVREMLRKRGLLLYAKEVSQMLMLKFLATYTAKQVPSVEAIELELAGEIPFDDERPFFEYITEVKRRINRRTDTLNSQVTVRRIQFQVDFPAKGGDSYS